MTVGIGKKSVGRLGALALPLLLIAALGWPSAANAQRGIQIGFNEALFATADRGPGWLDQARQLGTDVVRVNVRWNGITSGQPADPTNPGDSAYDFEAIDRAVLGARQRGMRVMLTVYQAPPYAEGGNRPGNVEPGTWKPRPRHLAQFGTALASRYSGSFMGLPRVQMMTPWIEPNISRYLTPQWQRGRPFGARHYRKMQNAFYDAVKRVRRGIHVMTAGTAPFGDGPKTRGKRTRPMDFWREVLCMRRNLRPKRCVPRRQRARFDSLAHHPIGINSRGRPLPPRKRAGHRDEVVIANFGQLRRLLRAAERHKRTGRRGRHGLWAPEIWWQTKPRPQGVSPRRQARFMSEGLFLLWKQGANGVVFLQLVDSPFIPSQTAFQNYQTGVFTAGGKRKPSYNAVRFPFVTERRGRQRLFAWGRAPRTGRVVIQMRRPGGRFRPVARKRARAGRVFTARFRAPNRRLQLRARVRGQTSMVWRQGRR